MVKEIPSERHDQQTIRPCVWFHTDLVGHHPLPKRGLLGGSGAIARGNAGVELRELLVVFGHGERWQDQSWTAEGELGVFCSRGDQ